MKYSHSFTAHCTNTLKRTKRIKYGKVHVLAVKLQDMILNPRGWEVCFFYHIQLQYNHLWQQFTTPSRLLLSDSETAACILYKERGTVLLI